MKTIALFTLPIGAGIMTVPSDFHVSRPDHYAPLRPIDLAAEDNSNKHIKGTAVLSSVLPKSIHSLLKKLR